MQTEAMYCVLTNQGDEILATELDERGELLGDPWGLEPDDVADFVDAHEDPRTRWTWHDTGLAYPPILAAGVRVERAHDLRLCRAILRRSALTEGSGIATAPRDALDEEPPLPAGSGAETLFEVPAGAGLPDPVTELRRQLKAVAGSPDPGRLRLLLAAESAGGLAATEMRVAGLPWDSERHRALLTELLGPRVPAGQRPLVLEQLAARIRDALDAPTLNPDSPQEVLSALQSAGLQVTSTRSAELSRIEHPVIEPLLEYKKRVRLLTANGWSWLDTWVVDGRFHADFLPGGVPSGRWAARGGGALQLPKQVRSAVVAHPGWKLVVADAAQLEPRVLAAMSGDTAMAAAGRAGDLYEGIVATGAVPDRNAAKYAVLGAIYGATAGQSGRLLPSLARAFPQALGLVESAARAGERGEKVTTRLGRSSPAPDGRWRDLVSAASGAAGTPAEESRARSILRERGRFSRNFVVQGTAAEWALCWLADLRRRLAALRTPEGQAPELVYFLHDEVMVHAPEELAAPVAEAVRAAADSAGNLLFPGFPIPFPLEVTVVDDYGQA